MENNSVREEKEMEIDLVSLFFYLINKWKILLLGGIIGGILAGAIVFFQTPMYESNCMYYQRQQALHLWLIYSLEQN